MGWILPLVFFILAIIFTVIVVIVRIKLTDKIKKIDVPENAPLIIVGSRRKYTEGGYGYGLVKKQKLCKNGCTRIEYYPLDYEQGEYIKRPGVQRVVVKNEFIKRQAQGEDSPSRSTIILIERFKMDLPRNMKNTKEGEEMSKAGQKAFIESVVGDYVRSGDEAISEAISDMSRIGISKSALAQVKEFNKAMREGKQQEEQDSKK